MKKRFTLFLFSFLGSVIFWENGIHAQPQPYHYCIYVKQGFSSWCDCSNGDEPVFDWADIQLKSETSTLAGEIIHSDKLNQKVLLNLNLHNDGVVKSASNLTDLNGNPVSSIYVHTRAGDIVNDNYLEYSFKNTDLKIGENTQSKEASDPCHNFISNNREGYTMTTNVYVDDPVYIENVSGKNSFCLDYETLSVKISDFFLNGRSEKTVLQVALDNELPESKTNWVPVDVGIYPKATINLTYTMIAGRKGVSSNYYSWMGHNLKFRVVKTLYNGVQTYGNQITTVKFYPEGLQYSITQTRRTYCDSTVIVTAKLDNSADEGYITKIDPAKFYWAAAPFVNGKMTDSYKCTMTPVDKELFTYHIEIRDKKGKDPFSEPTSVPMEWRMQLMRLDDLNAFACVKPFTIPPKPPAVSVGQKPDKPYTVNGIDYHIPDSSHAFAMLEIADTFAFASLRQPYKIFEGSNELLKLGSLPSTYDEMTQTEKDALDAQFETEFSEMITKTNNPYRTYFKMKLNEWMNDHKSGTPLPIPSTYDGGTPYIFSNDTTFFLFAKWYTGTADIVYKATINSNGTYTIEQKTENGLGGIVLTDISPDNNTLVYTLGSCCSDASVWKVPLNISGSNNASEVTLPFEKPIQTGNFSNHDASNIFFDNNNIIIYGSTSTSSGLYKKNLSTGSLTALYNGTARFPCLSPDGSFVLFYNYPNLYKGTVSGNSITNAAVISANCSFVKMSPDGTYALISKNNNIYKLALTGSQAGTETLAISRSAYKPLITKTNNCVYYYSGTSPDQAADRGIYLSDLNGGVGTKLCSVLGGNFILAPNGKYLIYTNYDGGNKMYKMYLTAEGASSDFYPNNDVALSWYNTYKASYKQLWLYQRVGVKVTKGIRVNEIQHLVLMDSDKCSYPFDIYVSAPPHPSFTHSVVSYPTDACAHNGSVRITYEGGGTTPYNHSAGTMSSIGNSIVVTGLRYGDNDIQFFDGSGKPSASYNARIGSETIGITTTPATGQTCPVANGTVTINVGSITDTKNYKLTCDYPHKEYKHSTTSNSYQFRGLPAGTYLAEVTNNGTCYFTKDSIVIDTKIFDITTPIATTDATTLDGTGNASLTFENRVNSVDISSLPSNEFGGTVNGNNKSYTVTPSTYTITAVHTDVNGTCSVSKNVTINKPQFSDSISLEETDTKLTVTTILSKANALLSPYKIRLLNASDRSAVTEGVSNGNLSTNIQTAGTYIISLQYGSGNYNADLCTFSYPLGIINNKNNVTSPKCPGGEAIITLTPTGGIDGSNFLFSLNGTDFSSTNTDTTSGETFSYDIKDDNTSNSEVFGNRVTVKKSLVKHFDIPVAGPAKVAAQKIIPVNVTCAGSNNGSVSVVNLSGGSGVYQFRVDDNAWQDPTSSITGLAPGNYTIYLRDSQNNCSPENLGTINIKEPDSLKIDNKNVVQPTCELPNGSISVEVKGGNKVYKYEWLLNGAAYFTSDTTSDSITNLGNALAYGLYSLHVTDGYCNLYQDIDLEQYLNPKIDEVSVTDVNCYGESNGSITILDTSGTNTIAKFYINGLDFSYSDSINDLSQNFDTLKKGRYEIFATDLLGCKSNDSLGVLVHQPDTVLYLIADTVLPVINKGASTGSIKNTVLGGNTGLKKVRLLDAQGVCVDSSMQKNQFPYFFYGLSAGNYTFNVSDRKGCSFTSGIQSVIEPDTALGFMVTAKRDALCKSQTGSLTVLGYGGWGGFKYKRASYNTYYNRNSFDDLYAGNYLVTVQDRLGATFSDTVVIYEPKDSLKSWVSGLIAPTCANNGGLSLDIAGGTVPYAIFNQTIGNSTPVAQSQSVNFTNLGAGNYLFNVTDSNGCHFDIEAELPDTNLLGIVRLDPLFPSGVGASDGAIEAIVHGGIQPYTYRWKQRFGSVLPETSSTLANIPSGHYELNVFETNGCSDTAYLYLPGINDTVFTIAETGNETSYMAHNGYCTLTSVFTSWQNFKLITPSGNQLNFNPADSTALFYYKNDSVFLRNLIGGNYFFSGITGTGEKVYAEFKIEPYLRFYISDVDVTEVDTTGGSNGKITMVVSGGGGDNKFIWERITNSGNIVLAGENYPESSILNSIPAGNYRITVTDRYNNSICDTILVLEPASSLAISIAEYKNESCKTYQDAYVVLRAEGGWGDYQFRDDSTIYFKNGNMFPDLNVRKHDFYLTDKKGTIRSISVNITEPDYLKSKIAFVDSVNCNGAIDGNIEFTITGGTAPYRFADTTERVRYWTQDTIARNIAAREYIYLFTDSNNCVGQDTLNVYMPEPDTLLFDKINVTHTTCNTDNGVIKIEMQGGTQPYRYEWYNFDRVLIGSDTVITNLEQNGLYTLDVYDWHNCPQHLEQRIKPSVNPIIADIDTIPVVCYGESNGIAYVTQIVPGTPYAPCSFTWSNNDTGRVAHGYSEGAYYVTISDTNHCSTVKYFGITQPDSLWVTINSSKNAHCYGYNDAFLNAEGRGGVGGYRYHWSTGDTTGLTSNLYKGSYSVSVTDANNCKNQGLFTITEPDKLLVNIGDDIKMCPGNSHTLDGKAFATHKWYTKQGVISNERYVTVKDANDYYLEVTDNIGCFAWDTLNISIGNDALKSEFLLTSQATLGDTLKVFELSNMQLDSLKWNYSDTIFYRVADTTGLSYILLLKTLENGIYNIDLYAYSGGCVSKSTKQVEIIGENSSPGQDDGLGYKDPLIISFTIAPNPNDGNFKTDIKLREIADIDLVLFTVSSGIKVDERIGHGQAEYSMDYSFADLNSGAYLLILKAQNERKQIKIIIQR